MAIELLSQLEKQSELYNLANDPDEFENIWGTLGVDKVRSMLKEE